jgi:DNA-3-methyladenine glycosylase
VEFEGRKSTDICRELIGSELIRREPGGEPTAGIVVEAESYVGAADPAAHVSGGVTERNKPFFGGPGNVYVFKIYQHSNLNFISTYEDHPECVLIRALEPTKGVERMRRRRGFEDDTKLCSGPGRLTEALDIDKDRHNNTALRDSVVELRDTDREPEIAVTERVGVSGAEDWPLRFVAAGNPHVSVSKPHRGPAHGGVEEAYRRLEESSPPTLLNQ